MRAISMWILMAMCTVAVAVENAQSTDWIYVGPARLEGALKPIQAKSYIKPDEVKEKSGLRYVMHRMVFAKPQASINRKYINEVHEEAAVSCVDGTVGVITVNFFDRDAGKLGSKVVAQNGLEMKRPDNDHHSRLIDAVCNVEIETDQIKTSL